MNASVATASSSVINIDQVCVIGAFEYNFTRAKLRLLMPGTIVEKITILIKSFLRLYIILSFIEINILRFLSVLTYIEPIKFVN